MTKNPNISSIFVHYKSLFNFEKYYFKKYEKNNCLICKFSYFHFYLKNFIFLYIVILIEMRKTVLIFYIVAYVIIIIFVRQLI